MKQEHNRNHDGAWIRSGKTPQGYPDVRPEAYEEDYPRERIHKGGVRIKKKRRNRGEHILGRFLLTLILLVVLLAGIVYGAFCMVLVPGLETRPISPSMNAQAAADTAMKGYTNIVLFGVDSRSQDLDSGDNRSDSMIICSIEKATGAMRLVSVYRDTYLEIGDGSYNKANASFAFGGPEQAVTMINRNLDLAITDYVTVGFEGLADMIDALGGVDIDIDSEEAGYLNSYLNDMSHEIGTSADPVTAIDGTEHLTGIQAVAYSRIRYTVGDDFRRTERQRTVLQAILARAKEAGPMALVQAARVFTDKTSTSLSKGRLFLLLLQFPRLSMKETTGIPREDLRGFATINGQSCVVPVSLKANVVWLHENLFGEEGYVVSPEVEERNSFISQY